HARGRPRQRPVLVPARAPTLPRTGGRDGGDRTRQARARGRDRASRGASVTENRLRGRAGRGGVQIGTWITMIRTPGVLTLLQAAGLDFARIDMEHGAFSMETVADMAALARALDFPG